jgi:hypothetical protein
MFIYLVMLAANETSTTRMSTYNRCRLLCSTDFISNVTSDCQPRTPRYLRRRCPLEKRPMELVESSHAPANIGQGYLTLQREYSDRSKRV